MTKLRMKQTKVKYLGATDFQVRDTDDPRDVLIEGQVYEVRRKMVFAWSTDIYLKGVEGRFNSVCFEEAQ